MHNNIMAAGSKERPPMLGPGRYSQWRSRFLRQNANPLALLATAQPYSDNYYQAPKPQRSNATSSSTRPSASTRHKGKEIAKPVTPQSESVSEEDIDPEQAQRDKDMQKNCHYLQRQLGIKDNDSCLGTRETVGSPVVSNKQDTVFKNCKGLWPPMQKNAEAKAYTDEEVDEQELEAHYSFMAKDFRRQPKNPDSNEQPWNRFAPNREETMTLANESRSKLNKDYVKPYDYTRHNSLYEIFKAPSLEYLYQTSNVNAVCAKCGKCVFNSNHDACVSRYLNDVNARTKKPKVLFILEMIQFDPHSGREN
ncbi:hypothetical protein Tco_0015344 [Tanacetum coccineum]